MRNRMQWIADEVLDYVLVALVAIYLTSVISQILAIGGL